MAKINLENLTGERRVGLRKFQEIYGDDWKQRMQDFHMGRPSSAGMHVSHIIRQIRNCVAANPNDLPDLRDG